VKRRVLAAVLAVLLLLSGCGGGAGSTDLMKGVEPLPTEKRTDEPGEEAAAVTDFGVRLLQQTVTEKNTLVSPVSVLTALAMTANGAEGETRSQMESTLGLSVEEANSYLHSYLEQIKKMEQSGETTLHMANSLWVKQDDSFAVQPEFLQTNASYYDAAVYSAPFDKATIKEINRWVEEHTGGMIRGALQEIPKDTVMYLLNALAFDAEWERIYQKQRISKGNFICEDGTEQKAELMHSEEYTYLEDELATGFLKYYKDKAYAFVALLPNEGISVENYVNSLAGEGLQEMLSAPQEERVTAAIPKFEAEFDVALTEILREMGMVDACSPGKADFSGLGTYEGANLYIKVGHKTRIRVDERGTQAGAVTIVEPTKTEAPAEQKEVILNRPFVYLLIDCQANLPLFMGTMMRVK